MRTEPFMSSISVKNLLNKATGRQPMSDTPLNILSGQLNELSGLIIDINKSSNALMTTHSESKEGEKMLSGQLKKIKQSANLLREAHTTLNETQTTLNGRLDEVNASSKLLEQDNLTLKQEKKESQSLINKQKQLINSLKTELMQFPLPQAPLMTTHDEQELISLLSSKDSLIQQQQTIIEDQNTTIASLKALIVELDR